MIFSELSSLEEETGLSYSPEHTALIGTVHGLGITVRDTGKLYEIKIFCEKPYESEAGIFPLINTLGESLPKNSLRKQECEYGYIRVVLNKYQFLQENALILCEFLEKLTSGLDGLLIKGCPAQLPAAEKEETTEKLPENAVRINLGFDLKSVLGASGAIIGAAAVTVIAALLVDPAGEISAFSLSFEVSAYVVAALSAVIIFMDYRYAAGKLDACGVLLCPVLSLAALIVSGLGACAKSCAAANGVSVIEAFSGLSAYLAANDELDKFLMGYLTRGAVLSVLSSVLICVFYFRRHADEMTAREKIRQTGKRH